MNRRLTRCARALVAVAALASGVAVVSEVRADSVTDQQQKIEQLAAQLNQLNQQIALIDEQYGAALEEKDALDAEIATAQQELAAEQGKLDELQGVMTDIAVEKFVGNNTGELSPLFSSAEVYSNGEQKDALSSVAFDTGAASADDLQSLIRKVDKDTKSLQRKQERQTELISNLESQRKAGEQLIQEYTQKSAEAKAKYGELVIQRELDRQAEIAADKAAAQAAAQAAAEQQQQEQQNTSGNGNGGGTNSPARGNGNSSNSNSGNSNAGNGNSGNSGGSGSSGGSTSKPKPQLPVPPPSGRAGIAIQAAYSVIGTPYVAFANSPSTGFDCSGLTQWAWAQAGVSLPHYSQAQYRMFPHVPQSQAQPGDLVFFYSPISHVGLYVGGGMMIDSPHTGATVRLKAVRWSAVVGVSRPG